MMSDSDLVYSTNPDLNRKCERCKKVAGSCTCPPIDAPVDLASIRPVMRIEKAHRGGKDVTVIDRLPANETFLKQLSQDLKKRCGTGGTYRLKDGVGIVEIQGDKREQVKKELEGMGIRCK